MNFADRSILLTPTPNDPGYGEQWNLRATDVEGAWRFNSTQTRQVLLVSLDTGIVTANELITDSQDLDRTRLVFDPTKDDDNYNDSSHGQRSISIMAATPNNNILTETAMDVGVVGRDDYYDAGLVNAEAAVRRAYALGRDRALAQTWKIFTTA